MGLDIHIGPKLQQRFHGVSPKINHSKHECCATFKILRIHVGAIAEQRLNCFRLTMECSTHQRSIAPVIPYISRYSVVRHYVSPVGPSFAFS
jgi:hypothetical protein